MIRTLIHLKKKVVFVLPYVSLVEEKLGHFSDILMDTSLSVQAYYGNKVSLYD